MEKGITPPVQNILEVYGQGPRVNEALLRQTLGRKLQEHGAQQMRSLLIEGGTEVDLGSPPAVAYASSAAPEDELPLNI